jgi:Transposase DDE domain group 1
VVKRIAVDQSRRNAARRARKVQARHRLAGHLGVQLKPMLTSGKINYEVGDRIEATPYGGLAAIHQMVVALGLPEAINDTLHLLRVHMPYHESDHVLNLAYNVLTGGKTLQQIERLRHDVAYMNALGAKLIPDPTTAGDFCRRFDESDVVDLMEAINAVRVKLWKSRCRDLLGPVAYIDTDGTMAPTGARRKQGIGLSYKGIWGYAPLVVTLANTQEVLYLVNRPGNVASHEGAADWIDKAIDLVSPYAPRVCLRGDTDFSLTANFDKWAERCEFVFGMDNIAALRKPADALDASQWRRLEREPAYQTKTGKTRARRDNTRAEIVRERGYLNKHLNFEHVAEFSYRPGKCARDYRIVALRKNISHIRGDQVLFDEIRYFFYVTTYSSTTHTAEEIIELGTQASTEQTEQGEQKQDDQAAQGDWAEQDCQGQRTEQGQRAEQRDGGRTAEQVVGLANARCNQENIIGSLKSGINALRVPLYDLISNWAYMVIACLAWNIKAWFAMTMHRKVDRAYYIRMEFGTFFDTIIHIPAMVVRSGRSITVRLIGYTVGLARLYSVWCAAERLRFG